MKLAGLAWKNLWRYRRRTMITAVALAYGLGMFIFIDGMLRGAEQESEMNLVRYETASIRIMSDAYFADRELMPLTDALPDYAARVAELEAEGYAVAPRTSFTGEMIVYRDPYPEDGSLPVRVVALDPARDGAVYDTVTAVDRGRMFDSGAYEAVIGSWLAEDIGADVGYPLLIETRDFDGFRQTFELEIVGILTTPNPNINRSSIYMPIDVADDVLFMVGHATDLSVGLPDYRAAANDVLEIESILDDEALTVVTWRALAADYLALAAAKQGGTKAILGLVIIIAAVGISNTMLMSIFERTREIGMMQAIGMTRTEIRRQFLLEAAGIGLVGGLIGLGIGAAANVYMVNWGISFGWFTRDMDIGYRIADTFRSVWNPGAMALSVLFGVALSVAIAWLSTRRIMKMRVIDAIQKG